MQKITWKKNWLGVLLWLCFCTVVCGTFVLSGKTLFEQTGCQEIYSLTTSVILLLAVLTAFFFLLRVLHTIKWKKKRVRKKEMKQGAWEMGAFLLLVFLQVAAVFYFGIDVQDTAFLKAAQISTEGEQMLLGEHTAFLYSWLLSRVFLLFGNHLEVAVWFQLALRLTSAFLFFCVIKKMFGRAASVIFLMLFAAMLLFLRFFDTLSPEWLLCLCSSICLLVFTELAEALPKERIGGLIFLTLFLSVLLGIFLWLNSFGIFIWLAAGFGILQLLADCSMKKRIGVCLTVLLLSPGVVAGCFGIEAWLSGKSFLQVFAEYLPADLYLQAGKPASFSALPILLPVFVLSMISCAAVIAFFKQAYERTLFVTLLLAGFVFMQYTGLFPFETNGLWTFLWLFAACAGIQCLLDAREAASQEDMLLQPAMPKALPDAQTLRAEEESLSPNGVQYIPNPLPLPKKHVKKELKFDLDTLDEQMEFDYEISPEKDDFDLT